MRKSIAISAISAIMLLPLIVSDLSSQVKQNFAKRNTWETGGSISYSNLSPVFDGESHDGIGTFTFAPYGGYFITDGFEIGLIPSVEYITYNDDDATTFSVYLAPAYNFYTKSIVYPYLQGAIGYNSVAGSGFETRSGVAWKLEGGVKINAFGNSLLKLGIDYGQQTLETSSSTGDRDGYNSVNVVLGFNVFFN